MKISTYIGLYKLHFLSWPHYCLTVPTLAHYLFLDLTSCRGEKAFCSVECRSKEILSDEIEEAVDDYDKSPKSKSGDGLFQSGSFLPS